MQHDIHAQAQCAQAEMQQAVARLDAARAAYQGGAGMQYGQAVARRAELQRKSAAADADVQAADAAFRSAFEAAGFERTEAVRAAQRRKGEAQDLAEATRAALERCGSDLGQGLIDASAQGREYVRAHEAAYAAYARAQAHQAIAEAGAQIARAMALMAHVRLDNSAHEDWQGRTPPTEAIADDLKTARSRFILRELSELAKAQPEYAARPHVEMLGACDLGPLSERELLTPGQVHKARCKLERLPTAQ